MTDGSSCRSNTCIEQSELRDRLEHYYGEKLDDKTFRAYKNKIIELAEILIAMDKSIKQKEKTDNEN